MDHLIIKLNMDMHQFKTPKMAILKNQFVFFFFKWKLVLADKLDSQSGDGF